MEAVHYKPCLLKKGRFPVEAVVVQVACIVVDTSGWNCNNETKAIKAVNNYGVETLNRVNTTSNAVLGDSCTRIT